MQKVAAAKRMLKNNKVHSLWKQKFTLVTATMLRVKEPT